MSHYLCIKPCHFNYVFEEKVTTYPILCVIEIDSFSDNFKNPSPIFDKSKIFQIKKPKNDAIKIERRKKEKTKFPKKDRKLQNNTQW